MTPEPAWLDRSRRLAGIAQSGLAYDPGEYDAEWYELVREIAAEIAAVGPHAPLERVRGLFAHDVGHATPKLDVRGAVLRGHTLLLVRERADGRWTLPGGWADLQETPSEAVEREVREESGYRVRAVRLLALWDRRKHRHPPHPWHVHNACFRCEPTDEQPGELTGETDAARFFPMERLPELATRKLARHQIERVVELAGSPTRPADFD